jgi:hypothetical protein
VYVSIFCEVDLYLDRHEGEWQKQQWHEYISEDSMCQQDFWKLILYISLQKILKQSIKSFCTSANFKYPVKGRSVATISTYKWPCYVVSSNFQLWVSCYCGRIGTSSLWFSQFIWIFLKQSFKNECKYIHETRWDFPEQFPGSNILHHNSVRQLIIKLCLISLVHDCEGVSNH